uniref:G_PROTEIN_RECEP_F1_2 domain-containing protein n=1 Tax=Elaeophora elaphi TaxID=1147741 RepID=A0A0R3S5I3_9BILA
MNFTINITRIEHLVNATNIKTLTKSDVNHYSHIYGYLIIGPMLLLINIPVFLLVMTREALRVSYLVLAVVFLNSALTGMSIILVAMKRLMISVAAEEQYLLAHYNCIFDNCNHNLINKITVNVMMQIQQVKFQLPILLLTMFFLNG